MLQFSIALATSRHRILTLGSVPLTRQYDDYKHTQLISRSYSSIGVN